MARKLTLFHRLVWLLMPPTAFCSVALFLLYFAYRMKCLLLAQWAHDAGKPIAQEAKPQSLILAWFFYFAEFLTIAPDVLPYLLRIIAIRQPNRYKDALAGDHLPDVDILITCCNEEVDVILDTVRAACFLDYPRDHFRIFVCDDGSSTHVRSSIEQLHSIYPNCYYTSRLKGPVKDYKAGNLNHGLLLSRLTPKSLGCSKRFSEEVENLLSSRLDRALLLHHSIVELAADDWETISSKTQCGEQGRIIYLSEETLSAGPTGSKSSTRSTDSTTMSEYIAGLDADMIPEPHWLRTMLPHLICDEKVALACCPQTFYDIPINDPLTQNMDHFAGISEVINDALGHADCLGSGYVARRSAIESIGGFPIESLSEDVCCSSTLLGAGWKTVFVQEVLQHGSVPDSFLAHVKQRTRWFIGHVQTAVLFRFRFWGARGRQLGLVQRLVGLVFDLRQVVQVLLAFNYLIIPLSLLSGYPLVIWTQSEELQWLIRLAVAWTLCRWLHQAVMSIIGSLGNGRLDMRITSYDAELEQWMAPYMLSAFVRSFILPASLGGVRAGFTATGSLHSVLHERDSRLRAPLHRRLYVALVHHWLIVHVLLIAACAAGVTLAVLRACTTFYLPSAFALQALTENADRIVYLTARVGWPPFIWLQYCASALSPVVYSFFPPSVPDRQDLLNRDEKTLVAYPKAEARIVKRSVGSGWRFARVSLAALYSVALLVLSEIMIR